MLPILVAFLVAGILFLILPIGTKRNPTLVIKRREIHISSIRATIVFVGELSRNAPIEGTLAYSLLQCMTKNSGKRVRHVWLLHGPCPEKEEEISCSSYGVMGRLQQRFQNSGLKIMPRLVTYPFDPHDTFAVVNEVFTTEVPQMGLREADVICNYTGGPKPVAIGMALACAGRRRLAYSGEGKEDVLVEHSLTFHIEKPVRIKMDNDEATEERGEGSALA